MNIRFHKRLYSSHMSKWKLISIQNKIKRHSKKLAVFLITLPIGNQGMMEIYWYPELLQSYYQKMNVELEVIGIAYTRREAFELVKDIVEDAGVPEGKVSIVEFFKEHT